MTVQEVQHVIEQWAPTQIAWERDNIGLQVGDPRAEVHGILIALDMTASVADEALKRGANLIVTHHPLIFHPLRAIRKGDRSSEVLQLLIRHNLNLYSAHTNLDFAPRGTSFALAEALALQDIRFLQNEIRMQEKIVTFVPPDHVDNVATAMSIAGAGRIGNYSECSFRAEGAGTFKGNAMSNPRVGNKNKLESSREVRLEMIVDSWCAVQVIEAMRNAHPYEEVAFDRYPLRNDHPGFGMGAIGQLEIKMTLSRFLESVKRALKCPAIRYTGNLSGSVSRVAVCGGSGVALLQDAIAQGADAFLTADIKYHSFQEAEDKISLVDAGHFETEQPIVPVVAKRLQMDLKRERVPVIIAKRSTNPVQYYVS